MDPIVFPATSLAAFQYSQFALRIQRWCQIGVGVAPTATDRRRRPDSGVAPAGPESVPGLGPSPSGRTEPFLAAARRGALS